MKIVHTGDPGFEGLWEELWNADEIQHPFLTRLDIAYSREFERNSDYHDLSFVVVEQLQPLAGARFAVRRSAAGEPDLSGFGRPAIYCENSRISADHRAGAHTAFRAEIQRIWADERIATARYREFRPILSPLGSHLLENGAQAKLHFTQVIDLSGSEEELRARVRKSYKSLINWGEKNLSLTLRDQNSARVEDMEAFRLLHIEVAGLETRTPQTWKIQMKMIQENEAFLVLGYWDNALVTAAIFIHSPRYCYYGASASKRELFEKPLTHAVIWKAILHAKEIGCRWFEVGEQLFPAQTNSELSPKEQKISAFKKGFGGSTCIRTDIMFKSTISL